MTVVAALACIAGAVGYSASFAPFDEGLPRTGQWRNGFAVGDVNGDGHIDIVHGPARKGRSQPVIYLGNGNGQWKEWTAARFPEAAYDYGDAALGDFDGDGNADLAFAMHMKGFLVLTGDGNGNFERLDTGLPYAANESAPDFSSRSIEVADWDGDGRPDLLANGEGPRIAIGGDGAKAGSRGLQVFLNNGGRWRVIREDVPMFGDAIAVGDFDGDSRPDAMTASHVMGERDLAVMNSNGDAWTRMPLAGLPGRVLVWAAAAGDFDGDGRDEAVLGWTGWGENKSKMNGVSHFALENDVWTERTLVSGEGAMVTALAAGDADGDGALDLAAGDDRGGITLWRGDGSGALTAVSIEDAVVGEGRCYHLAFADCNGDGAEELFAGFARERESGFGNVNTQPANSMSDGSIRAWSVSLHGESGGSQN